MPCRKINSITKSFALPIIRSNYTISIIGSGSNKVWIIILDSCQGYHKVAVKNSDRDKLALFSPNNKFYFSNDIQFVTTNTPVLYCYDGITKRQVVTY